MAKRNTNVNICLLISTSLAVIIGVTLGICLRFVKLNPENKAWIQIWGELFIRMFSAIALPLILSCIIVGITGLKRRVSGALGLSITIYMLITTSFSILLPIAIHLLLKPGHRLVQMPPLGTEPEIEQSYTDLFTDLLRNLFPDNMVTAAFQTVHTEMVVKEETVPGPNNDTAVIMTAKKLLKHKYGINTLGLVVLAVVFAYAIRRQGKKAKPLSDLCYSVQQVVFSVIDMILWYSPIGVCSLITGALISEEHLLSALLSVLFFLISVSSVLLMHAFIVLPVLYVVVMRRNPFVLYVRTADAMIAGFAAPSSMVAMSVCLENVERRLQVRRDIAAYVMPIILVFIKNGSNIFVMASIMFLAESQGIPLHPVGIIFMGCLVAIVTASVPNIPSGSIFAILAISSGMNLPVQSRLPLLFTVEWLLDRLRTANNIAAMIFGVPIINKMATCFANDVIIPPPITKEEDKLLQNDYAVDVDISYKGKMNGKTGAVICDEIQDGPESVV